MRSDPDSCRLTFMLPDPVIFAVPAGRHHPCLHGCILSVSELGLVMIEARLREQTFEQADRFLHAVVPQELWPLVITAVLASPCLCGGRGGRDGWTIIVGAEIAFPPTAL